MAIEVDGVCPYFEVYDMPSSIRFYRDQLGFEIVSTSHTAAATRIASTGACCGWAARR